MAVNLHLLRFFVAVVEEGGFSRAAERLHVSQPAISRGLKELEGQIGAPLIERAGRSVRLTDAGVRLIGHARVLFATERAMEDEISVLRGLEGGVLRIAASTTVSTYVLPEALGRFHRLYPAVELHLTSANTHQVWEMLQARDVDIAIVEGPVTDPGTVCRPWIEDELLLIAPPAHPAANPVGEASLATLAGELFVVREEGSGTREVAFEALARAGLRPVRLLEISSSETIVRVVAAGLGVAMVSRSVAADHVALGKVRAIALKGLDARRRFNRLTVAGRQSPPAAVAFDRILDEMETGPRPAFLPVIPQARS